MATEKKTRRRTSLKDRHRNAQMRLEMAQMRQLERAIDSLPTFAVDPDENDWIKVSGSEKTPYTEQSLQDMRTSMQKLQYTCAGRGLLQTLQDFIIGENASIDPIIMNEDIVEYWEGWQAENNWDLRSKEIVRRTFRDGEVFLRWFMPDMPDGHMKMRFIDPAQIKQPSGGDWTTSYGIETDVDDIETAIAYHREWQQGSARQTERISADEVDHIKILVDSDVKRGVSFFTGLAKWMNQYELWLRDRYLLNRVRHIWNVVAKTTGGTDISALKQTFNDVTRDVPSGGTKNKKQPKPGSILFAKNTEFELQNLKINAADTKDDGRAFQLMVAIGAAMPEYIIRGDASNSNYASTMVSESPFVRSMTSWQDLFRTPFMNIYARVITHGLETGKIPTKVKSVTYDIDPKTGVPTEQTETVDTTTECTVNFATLIHRDIKEETEAQQIHTQNGWCSNKTASENLGYDFFEEQEQIAKEDAAARTQAAKDDLHDDNRLKGQPNDDDKEDDEDQ